MHSLSKGSLRKILDGNNVTEPLLQILQMKTIQNNQDGMVRYKVTLFDGEIQHTFGILATQKNFLVDNGELKVGSVIKLDEYAANVLSKDPPKVVIILLNFEIVGEMDTKPQTASDNQQSKPMQNENIEPKKEVIPQQSNAKSFFNNKDSQSKVQPSGKIASASSSSSSSNQPGTFNGFKIFGISSLNPYQNKWSIKARAVNKSQIRTWSNAKGEGKLFSVEFLDQTGEIRASGFNDQVDKFYDLLQVDNVYYISKATLKTANKQYNQTVNNDYEMTFTNETVIEPCDEADNIPHINVSLLPLSELVNKNPNETVDVIGVVKSCSEVTTIVARQTGKELKKRELHLVDSSNCSVNCTLWGKQAEDFDATDNPVIVLKGAKLSDYGGRSLSVLGTTMMQINPDIPECHAIRGWFDQGGCQDGGIQDLSNQNGSQGGGGAGSSGMSQSNWKTLDQCKDEKLGMSDKADYFTSKAIVLYAKKDNSMYMACPGENCNKKVIDQNDGYYRCEKCDKSYPNFKWRMILSINIADFTESQWATCFQETAECILGIKADELGNLKNSNNPNFDEIFANCVFTEFIFKMRAKMETYNDERRVKVSVVSVEPIDYVTSSKRLLQKIKLQTKNQI